MLGITACTKASASFVCRPAWAARCTKSPIASAPTGGAAAGSGAGRSGSGTAGRVAPMPMWSAAQWMSERRLLCWSKRKSSSRGIP